MYPSYGDIQGAWAQGTRDENQFIEIKFPQTVYATKIHIYETYHCGAVVRVKLKNPEQNIWQTVWENPNGPELIETSRIFCPPLSKTDFKTQVVRLEVDCSLSNNWCEIDAVGRVLSIFSLYIGFGNLS